MSESKAAQNGSAGAGQIGQDLTPEDYARLAERWITPELAAEAGLRRVTSLEGRDMFGRKKGDLAGIVISNRDPWNGGQDREYRLRLDHLPIEQRADGSRREGQKYIQPPGRGNLLYFPVGVTPEMLADVRLPILITEGEFKAIAAWRCACFENDSPRFVPVAVAGVWNFRGTVGKTTGPNGSRRDVGGVIPDIERISWTGRQVIIAYDTDVKTNSKVRIARWVLRNELLDRHATIGILEWPAGDGKGIDDWLAKVGPEKVLKAIADIHFGDWRSRLIYTQQGNLAACIDNAALMLEHNGAWEGVLAYNEFDGGYYVRRPPPEPVHAEVGEEITDIFDTEVTRWLERKHIMVTPSVVHQVVNLVARRNSFHPVRDYLNSLPSWDRTERIGTWLRDYCGVVHSDVAPNHFAMAAGRKFLISAVARVFGPGSKVDHVLVIEGVQGLGKSTVVRILAGDEFYSDQLGELGSKDASMQLRGVWIMELAELGQLLRTENAQAKAFFTRQMERFRPPYGRRLVAMPRQCVFVGTINSDSYLLDETGNRRYWPVYATAVKLDKLRQDRDRLWAEALHAYRKGERCWLEDKQLIEEAIEEQRDRYVEDPWQARIREYVDGKGSHTGKEPKEDVSIWEVLRDGLWLTAEKCDQRAANRVVRCLTALDWRRYRARDGEKREPRYRRLSKNSI
jgi:predicted P-loop ATPase